MHLRKWDYPTSWDSSVNFIGEKPNGYSVYSRNRESSILENTNFEECLNRLGGESEWVEIVCHKHWACGWIEYLMLKENAPHTLIEIAIETTKELDAYPILNEHLYTEAQLDSMQTYWDNLSIKERIDYCKDAGISIFAARHSLPQKIECQWFDSDMFN
jgi:hypothetical protein